MNKIICDKCKKYIELQIESKHLTGGIRINYFRCNSCKEKYLIDVTDQTTREKQIGLSTKQKYQSGIMEYIEKNKLSAYSLSVLEEEIVENNKVMGNLLKEIKESKAELKERYEGEL